MRRAVAPGGLELDFHLPCVVELHSPVCQRRPGDVAALLPQPLAVVCFDPHGRVQAEPVDAGTQKLARHALARHRAVQSQYLVPGARPEGDAVVNGRRLQWPQGARFVPVGLRFGQVDLPHLLDQHAVAREHLHQSGDDRVQQRVQFVVCGLTGFDEGRHSIAAAPVHPVQYQAVQVDVEVGLLMKKGAEFGSRNGWERSNYFRPAHTGRPDHRLGKPGWLPWLQAEQKATREAVAL